MKTILCYCIPGLGVDGRIFEDLSWPEWIVPRVLDWIEPLDEETVQGFASRMSGEIETEQDFMLLGVSFGGILAGEISKILDCRLTVLVSSVRSPEEMPVTARALKSRWIAEIVTSCGRMKGAIPGLIAQVLLGATAEEARMLLEIFRNADRRLIQWSLNSIGRWKTTTVPRRIFTIHGAKDKLFPVKDTHPDVVVEGGGHLIIMTHGTLIGKLIEERARAAWDG